jgi:DNA-binding CsgD family transcriptional regulator
MFLLPPRLRELLDKRPKGRLPRVYSRDEQLVLKVRELALSQQRGEQEVYDDLIQSGMQVLEDKDKYEELWVSLSQREQQVTALTCLGYRSYEIAGALGISYETVRTHSKHVYAKFGLNRKELRLALKRWNFEEWWGDRQV